MGDRERSRNPWSRGRSAWYSIVGLATIGLVATFAFARLFTIFATHDDEGYFLQAYREFLSGRILYDQVFTLYGPLTFFIPAAFAGFDAANITHDALRWTLLPFWVLIAAMMAGTVWRWTGRFAPSLGAFLLTGFDMFNLAGGVGHPEVWIILAAVVLVWVGLDCLRQKRHRQAFLPGAIIGLVFLLKINIGLFLLIGFVLAMGLHFKGAVRFWLCGMAGAAAAGIGTALFLTTPTSSEKYFAVAYMTSLAVTISIAARRSSKLEAQTTSLLWFFGGLIGCVCLGLAATLALGTTPSALFRAFVTVPAQFAASYHNPFLDAMRNRSLAISATVLFAALGVFFWRPPPTVRTVGIGLLKVVAGLTFMLSFFYDYRPTLTGSLLILWLLIVDLPPESGLAYSNRLLLALFAPLFSLQLYPMAGSQVAWASLMPITAAAVLVGDGLNSLAREVDRGALPRRIGLIASGAGTLLTLFLFAYLGESTWAHMQRWRAAPSLNLPGARWLHLPPAETARLTSTVAKITQNCQAVLYLPGLYSFWIWSGVPPVEEKRINTWPFLWPDEVQKNELRSLGRRSQACVLVSRDVYGIFKGFAVNPGRDELLLETQRTMHPVDEVQDLILYRSTP